MDAVVAYQQLKKNRQSSTTNTRMVERVMIIMDMMIPRKVSESEENRDRQRGSDRAEVRYKKEQADKTDGYSCRLKA